uniref:Nuclear pore complex protein Nup153 n=1 Tax=Phallusia mammillata TaxID=59560 RepID=A0A6F9DR29_9ASCI|nr:ZF(RBZ)-2 zinc finger protein [Phallusia mammillata]
MESGGGKIRIKKQTQSRKPYTRPVGKSLFSRVSDSVKSLLTPITPHWLTKKSSSRSDDGVSVERSELTSSRQQNAYSPFVTPPETPNFVLNSKSSIGESTSVSNDAPLFIHQQSGKGISQLDSSSGSSEDTLKLWSNTTLSNPQSAMTSILHPNFNSNLQSPCKINSAQSPLKVSKIAYKREKVQYGGAMAGIKTSSSATPYRIPHVRKVRVRAPNTKYSLPTESSNETSSPDNVNSAMSSTAKKILQTLEKMSTPLHDTKKIPVPKHHLSYSVMRQRRTLDGSLSATKTNLSLPPTEGLTALSPVSIHKTANIPLENSITSQGVLKHMFNKQSGSITSMPSTSKILGTNVTMSSSTGVGGKIKTHRRTAHYTAAQHSDEIQPESPPLPSVPLPISAALPSFNFGRPGSTSTPAVSKLQPTQQLSLFPSKKREASGPEKPLFNFADPTPKLKSNPQSSNATPSSLPQFQFSLPAESVGDTKVDDTSNLETVKDKPVQLTSPEADKIKKKTDVEPKSLKSTKTLVTTGSVMDVLGVFSVKMGGKGKTEVQETKNEKPNPLPIKINKWECGTCMLMNTMDKECCVACQSSKPQKNSSTGFPSSLLAADKWQCTVCLLMNKDTADKCVACQSPKLKEKPMLSTLFKTDDKWDCPVCMVKNKKDVATCIACETAQPGSKPEVFAKKLSTEKWECNCCMLRVDADKTTCPACQTPKTGSTTSVSSNELKNPLPKSIVDISGNRGGEKFSFGVKKQPSSIEKWECGTCLLWNKPSCDTCPACQTPKPSLQSSQSDKKQLKPSSGENNTGKSFSEFAPARKSKWECNVCLVHNSIEKKNCIACQSPRPGMSNEEKPSQFSFGKTSTSLFKFGTADKSCLDGKSSVLANASNTQSGSLTFKFGAPSSSKVSEVTSTSESDKSFSFGIPATNKNGTNKRTADTLENKDEPCPSQSSKPFTVQTDGSPCKKINSEASTSITETNKVGVAFDMKTNVVPQSNPTNHFDPGQKLSIPHAATPQTLPTFGTTSTSLTKQTTSFKFGLAPQAKLNDAPIASSFQSSKPSVQFGIMQQKNSNFETTVSSSQNQPLQFGVPLQSKPMAETIPAGASQVLPTFGASNADVKANFNDPKSTSSFGFSSTQNKSSFSFGVKKSDDGVKTQSIFGQSSTSGDTIQKTQGFTFSGTNPKPQQSTEIAPQSFSFASSNQATDTSQPGFQFGSGSKGVMEKPAAGFNFSKNPNTSATTFDQKPTFQFGAKPEGSGGFSFGGQQQTQPDSTSSFQFGASTATSNSFLPSASSAPQTGGSTMFSIGQANANPGRASTPVAGRQIKRATRRFKK